MIIAVDFDGTIVEQKYPKLGKEIPFATSTLKMLQEKGHQLILWTYRSGKKLDDAIEFCRSKGLEFYAVNKNYPEEVFESHISRKIKADMYIDDMNFGGLPDWGEIYQRITDPNRTNSKEKTHKKGLARIFG
ncbi:hydrolase [Ancylomarina salipaludis]|uniref:Hydrolase n=1 Tax=Ancylomarina salipaludis TaxID=2501299 RepID=A0A4V1MZY0_9BACT|nr:hydrolase [Ancylomarina salipaludis]RXQ91514.1 hydrolase [Ancylomarina salipaludis]